LSGRTEKGHNTSASGVCRFLCNIAKTHKTYHLNDKYSEAECHPMKLDFTAVEENGGIFSNFDSICVIIIENPGYFSYTIFDEIYKRAFSQA
jgi:hypothetical protein